MPRLLTGCATLAAAGIILVAAASATASDINIDIGLGIPHIQPPIVLTAPPQLLVVPGTSVYYAPEMPANYFFYKGRYYTAVNNIWSMAPAYNGPWAVIRIGQVPAPILSVPVEYYKVPPGHLKKKGPPPWAGKGHGSHPKKSKDK
jgi:hypothetical protein